MKEICFLGHKISERGIEADPRKVTAIINMPNPKSVKELQRFLRITNYVSKFIPSYSEITAPLRLLLGKGTVWYFDEPQETAIKELKSRITSNNVLKLYDQSLPIRVSCDASTIGLGAVLEQKDNKQWHPIAYSSRSLTSSEKNYSQIDREVLSIVFACNKYHQYIYGQKFEVYNDHLPLRSIFTKDIKTHLPD